jgi:hypothetical protein
MQKNISATISLLVTGPGKKVWINSLLPTSPKKIFIFSLLFTAPPPQKKKSKFVFVLALSSTQKQFTA